MNGVMTGLSDAAKDAIEVKYTGWVAIRDYTKKPVKKDEWWHEIHKGDIYECTSEFGSDKVRVVSRDMADRCPDYTGFLIPFSVAIDIFEPIDL